MTYGTDGTPYVHGWGGLFTAALDGPRGTNYGTVDGPPDHLRRGPLAAWQVYVIYVILNVPSRAHTWHLYVLALPLEDFWDIHRQLMTCELESLDLTPKKRIVMFNVFLD